MKIPSIEQPREIENAFTAVAEAERQLASARERQRSAAAALDEARVLDRADLSKRIAAGEEHPAPSREHRSVAEEQVEAADEVVDAASANVVGANEKLDRLVSERSAAWAERLVKARQKLDAEYMRLLDKLAGLEERRAELRGADSWLARRATGGSSKLVPLPGHLPLKHPQHADAKLPSALAISLLREYVEGSTVEAEEEAGRRAPRPRRQPRSAASACSRRRPARSSRTEA